MRRCWSNRCQSPGLRLAERHQTDTCRRDIARGFDQAFPPPVPLSKREDETKVKCRKRLAKKQRKALAAWRRAHRWHPHQFRHNAATELGKEFGIKAARIMLGHRAAAITEVYAERGEQQAIEAMVSVGCASCKGLPA